MNAYERANTKVAVVDQKPHRDSDGAANGGTEMEKNDKPPLLSFAAAVRELRTSAKRLRFARDTGQVHCVLLGSRWMVPRSEVARLLNQREGGEK